MRSLPLTLVLLLTTLLMACQPAAEQNKTDDIAVAAPTVPASCTLRAGFDAWEPYHYLGQGEQPQGLDIEILQAVATNLRGQIPNDKPASQPSGSDNLRGQIPNNKPASRGFVFSETFGVTFGVRYRTTNPPRAGLFFWRVKLANPTANKDIET